MKEKKVLEDLWREISEKDISFRPDGEHFIATITDRNANRYSLSGNVYVIFVNRSCVSLYQLIKRYRGNMDEVEQLLFSLHFSEEKVYNLIKSSLSILNGEVEHVTTNNTALSRPYFGHIDITSQCNMNCVHCLNPSENYQNDDLKTDAWLNVIDKFKKLGISVLWIGGGEPLLRSDLLVILSYAKSKNMRIVLASNGLLMDLAYAKQIAPFIDELTICLDGSTADIHGFLRKPKNTFDTILYNLKCIIPELHKNNCLIKIFTCVAQHNLSDVSNIIDLSANLGADSWACQTFVPMNRGKSFSEQVLTYTMRQSLATCMKYKMLEYVGKMQIQYYVPLITMEKVYSQR